MQWVTIFKKELLEDWRNFKWIWVPIVFILISIMDPLSTYYLPKILDTVGGLPEGTVMEFPDTPPTAVLFMTLSELSMFGVLVVVLISMGIISGERKSGVAELVLVKPVSYLTYITSKWTAKLVLIFVSYLIGMITCWYYVNLLFGNVSLGTVMKVILFYGLWLILILTITVFFNTLFKSPGVVGFVSIGLIILMSVINKIFSHVLTWFPNNLSSYILKMMDTGEVSSELWGTSLVTVLLIIILLFSSFFTFKGKEMAN